MVDFGTELFEGKVGHNPIVAWVNQKINTDSIMTGIRLVEFCYSRRDEKEKEFYNIKIIIIQNHQIFLRFREGRWHIGYPIQLLSLLKQIR